MTRSLLPRIAPVVGLVGAQGWIVLGLVAGVALAYRYSKTARNHRPRSVGRWKGEGVQDGDERVAIAS